MAKAYTEAQPGHGESELIDDIASTKPHVVPGAQSKTPDRRRPTDEFCRHRPASPPLAHRDPRPVALTMVGAITTHVRRGEKDRLAVPIVLLALTLFVAVERFGPHSL